MSAADDTTGKPAKRQRVQRVEDWDNARFAFTPPRAAIDPRLTLIHFRFMTLLGKVNTQQGWCSISQTKFAEALGYHRGSVVRAVSELVEWQYVEKQGQDETGGARCHYRILLDDPEPLDVGTCNVGGDTPTCNVPRDTGVTSHESPVSRGTSHISKIKDQRSLPPTPSMSTGCEQGGEVNSSNLKSDEPPTIGWASGWTAAGKTAVEEVRASNIDATAMVADVFIDAVRAHLPPFRRPDQAAYVAELGGRLRHYDRATLAALAEHQKATRSQFLDSIPNLELAIKRGFKVAGKAVPDAAATPGLTISAQTHPNAVSAWIAHAKAVAPRPSGNPKLQALYAIGTMLTQGHSWTVPSEFPPADAASNGATP